MTAPWPAPPAPPSATRAPSTAWGPLLGWLLLLLSTATSLLSVFVGTPWVSGRLTSGRVSGLDAGELVNGAVGVVPFAVLAAVVGLVVATWFALAAVPGGVASRTAVTTVVVLLEVLATAWGLGDDSVTPEVALRLVALLFWLPGAVLLLLVWRRARRGSAWTAAVFAAIALLGAVLVVLNVLGGIGTPGPGTWLALVLAAVGLAGAVLQLRTIPRRTRPLEPGDPGWTA